ncbi:MAG: hypothetical protein EOP48_05965 [Sphingobacteriales bacterium]|nr:MAG: hypothetical protein EOP48_05965 [Sphingobacteriales bacterium]
MSISLGCVGQSSHQINSFFQDFIRTSRVASPIIYTDKMPDWLLSDRIKAVDKDTIRGWNRNNIQLASRGRDSLILTYDERSYLIQQIGQQKSRLWKEGVIEGASLIPSDSIEMTFKTARSDWNKFHQNYGKEYYSFSTPIFLRDDSLCFFYYEQYCGYDCGNAEFLVYRKVQDHWELAFTFWGWVS